MRLSASVQMNGPLYNESCLRVTPRLNYLIDINQYSILSTKYLV